MSTWKFSFPVRKIKSKIYKKRSKNTLIVLNLLLPQLMVSRNKETGKKFVEPSGLVKIQELCGTETQIEAKLLKIFLQRQTFWRRETLWLMWIMGKKSMNKAKDKTSRICMTQFLQSNHKVKKGSQEQTKKMIINQLKNW